MKWEQNGNSKKRGRPRLDQLNELNSCEFYKDCVYKGS